MRPQPSRLAVQLHNRTHPIPLGLYVVIGLLILGGALLYLMAKGPSEEIRRLREDLKSDQENIDKTIQRSK